jgi:hypothetical protein
MKRLILILYLLILVLSINLNGAVTRNDVIYRASAYSTYNWVVKKPNPRYTVYRFPGSPITGVAYSWGGKESISIFQSWINIGKIPRNWEGNTQPVSKYAGIDCSGLVRNCWRINKDGIKPLTDACIGINKNKIKSGDILAKVGTHVVIVINKNYCYEAVGYTETTNTNYQRVRKTVLSIRPYPPFSPFPQFSDEYPADGAVVDSSMKLDSISVMICGKGNFTTSNVSMFVNGIKETNTEIIIKSDTSVQFIAYDSTYFDSLSGEVNVEVVARANSIKLLRERQLPVGTVEMEGVCLTNMIKSDIWYV